MKKIILPLLALTAAALATGCQTAPETGALLPRNTAKFNQETTANFVLLDPGAQQSVTSSGLQKRTLPDGRLQVDANIRNRENRRIQVQVNCVFKDDNGFAVDETQFETLILTENETQTKSFTSANAQAKNFTVRVRQAR